MSKKFYGNNGLGGAALEEVAAGGSGDLLREDGDASGLTGIPFSKYYESPETVIASGALVSKAHGLSVRPRMVQASLKCTTAEHGFSVGQEILLNHNSTTVAGDRFHTMAWDNTNIKVKFFASSVAVNNLSTGALAYLTYANWKLILRAMA